MSYNFDQLNANTEFKIEERVFIGKGVTFGPNCKKIEIGYGSFIGNDTYIDVPELKIGEYTTIHNHATIHGYEKCSIGNNCWIGQFCIIDSIAGTTIGNNVGIGAHSQLWTHIKFGDMLEGCNWNSTKPLIIEDDVWFVGHSIVSPITAKAKSMLMVGGLITKDMEENHIYAGSPAKDVTEKLGNQFSSVSLEEKRNRFEKLYKDFLQVNGLKEVEFEIEIVSEMKNYSMDMFNGSKPIYFLKERMYLPTRSELEFNFMRYLLYDKAKFNPVII